MASEKKFHPFLTSYGALITEAGVSRPGSQSGTTVAVLSKDGRLVYAALGARGLIAVYDAVSLRVHDVIKVRC